MLSSAVRLRSWPLRELHSGGAVEQGCSALPLKPRTARAFEKGRLLSLACTFSGRPPLLPRPPVLPVCSRRARPGCLPPGSRVWVSSRTRTNFRGGRRRDIRRGGSNHLLCRYPVSCSCTSDLLRLLRPSALLRCWQEDWPAGHGKHNLRGSVAAVYT